MIRTQIQLTEEQHQSLKELAAARRTSMAELIRQSVDQLLHSSKGISLEERRKRAIEIAGKYRSGQTDISTNHDKYLAEIYGS